MSDSTNPGNVQATAFVEPPVSRCTGHCCQLFWLPMLPEYFQEPGTDIQDGEYIGDMLRLLYGPLPLEMAKLYGSNNQYRYTCKHLSLDKTNCTAYEDRPRMCQNYPYGKQCQHKACTAREKQPHVVPERLMTKVKKERLEAVLR